ncbi:hypothetical protein AWZ03_013671 [Drosophila navojoa]|uniref:Uncharacterized protein n=1 Tax=Drosophila navojoa TaxID=7232 RepID=A0A484AT89_DRONA|nr:hypothetical protein AWZ03_013671 [Drosophila navojoa]
MEEFVRKALQSGPKRVCKTTARIDMGMLMRMRTGNGEWGMGNGDEDMDVDVDVDEDVNVNVDVAVDGVRRRPVVDAAVFHVTGSLQAHKLRCDAA